MEKIKNIITGILSVAVFFMAVQVGVAQQSITANADAGNIAPVVDVGAEANTLSTTLVNPVDNRLILQTDTIYWFPVTISGLDDEDPEQQEVTEPPFKPTPSGSCDPANNGQVCAVQLNMIGANSSTVSSLISQLNDPDQPNPTIEDFLDAGATHTGIGGSPRYAREL